MIWNGPSTIPNAGITSWNRATSPSKKICRARSSLLASRKTPEPEIDADRTPAPDKSSRHPPGLSRLVTSTVSALKLIRVARRPATVSNCPSPETSIFKSTSLPR